MPTLVPGCDWSEGFDVSDFDSPVSAVAVFDDGTGPALYVGGGFKAANGVIVNGIARWDGATWVPLSTAGGVGVDGGVAELLVYDDGSGGALYVAGEFDSAGGVSANNIARWDGSGWSALSGPSGNGADQHVYALAVYDDGSGEKLYAGGGFRKAGGLTANNVAAWDGFQWSTLATPDGIGVDCQVRALSVFDDGSGAALYAGGCFSIAGGAPANRVARWDGSQWLPLSTVGGNGVDAYVSALAVYDDGVKPALYVGGSFTTAGGAPADRIAAWDGSEWSPVGSGIGLWAVNDLLVWDDGSGPKLIAGGAFSSAGGHDVNNVAAWDGLEWSPLSGATGTGTDHWVYQLGVYDDGSGEVLVVGGTFTSAGGALANRIARWDGSNWSAFTGQFGNGVNDRIFAMVGYDDGSGQALYGGGLQTIAGGIEVDYISRWDGAAWSKVNSSSEPSETYFIEDLVVHDDGSGQALYAAGRFWSNVRRWDGNQWLIVAAPGDSGIHDVARDLEVYDDGGGPALYACGDFLNASGEQVNQIAKWDGSDWWPLTGALGTGTDDRADAMVVFQGDLYVGGLFRTAGGLSVNGIARWDGSTWSELAGPYGVGVDRNVYALAVFDDGNGAALYAGGNFTTAGGENARGIARWDGTGWSSLGSFYSSVLNLTTFDDGRGEALFAGGSFTHAGGLAVNQIARWDGSDWSALTGLSGTGVGGNKYSTTVYSLYGFDDGSGPALFAGGSFVLAGGKPSSHVAKWSCQPIDLGDAPAPYPTQLAEDGAWHIIEPGFYLGAGIDGEPDGQPNSDANGDDDDGSDDEDGISFTSQLVPGMTATLEVTASAAGLLDAWIDFNADGDWLDDGEQVFTSTSVVAGVNSLLVAVPGSAAVEVATYARFRLSRDGVATPVSGARDGEVEDYLVELVDTISPSPPSFLISSSHTPNTWSADAEIVFTWSGASDTGGSGLAGYSVLLDNEPATVPDDTIEVEHDSDPHTTSGVVTDGNHYFHMRACDGSGNCSATVHLGPYLVDTTAPANPSLIASSSHSPGTWSGYPRITISWSGAGPDDGSPLAGYSVLFDGGPGSEPDTLIDVGHGADPHDVTSDVVADGSRYFHLRTCDAVGNCAVSLHLGPYLIDTVPPTAPSAVGSTSHTPGVPSELGQIAIEWSGAADPGGSGLAGYSTLFDTTPATVPDIQVDIDHSEDPHTTTSAVLPNGSNHYFHQRACDLAGNCSLAVHLGPYLIDYGPPRVAVVETIAATGDHRLTADERVDVTVTQLAVTFNAPMNDAAGDADPDDVTNPDNYLLLMPGADGSFETVSCAGGIAGDETVPVEQVVWESDTLTARLLLEPLTSLLRGSYRLLVCGSTSVVDLNGVALDGNGDGVAGDDLLLPFTVTESNLLRNPNFDHDLGAWHGTSPQLTEIGLGTGDVDGAAASGSVQVVNLTGAGEQYSIEQCVPVAAGHSYRLGGRARVASGLPAAPVVSAVVDFFDQAGCAGAVLAQDTAGTVSGDSGGEWSHGLNQGAPVTAAAGAVSALVSFTVEAGEAASFTVDLDSVSCVQAIFADGFESGSTARWSATVP